MADHIDNVVVVLRAASERTLEFSHASLLRQISSNYLRITQENPFEEALRKSFQLGLESGKEWLITVDADVLLLPDALKELVEAASNMPPSYVELGARVFDKVLGSYRLAGNRIYRTSLLEKAINCIPPVGQEIRPEASTLRNMAEIGHSHRCIGLVTGIHDFEQYYADLYRKAFVHGQKHDYLAADLLKRCLRKKDSDPDFAVILRGFCDGIASLEKATIDARRFREQAQLAMRDLGLEEKASLNPASIGDWNAWVVSQLEFEPTAYTDHDLPRPPKLHTSAKERFRKILNERGLLFATKYAVGSGFVKLGSLLKKN